MSAAEPTGTCDERSMQGVHCLLERGHAGQHRNRVATWAPEPTPYTPSDGSLARALFDADVDATDPEVADRMWSRLAMAHSSWHEQADRLAPWLAARDARVRAEARRDALNEAAQELEAVASGAPYAYPQITDVYLDTVRWLRARAAETPAGAA